MKNKEAITKLVAHYIVNEKNKQGLPLMMLVDFI